MPDAGIFIKTGSGLQPLAKGLAGAQGVQGPKGDPGDQQVSDQAVWSGSFTLNSAALGLPGITRNRLLSGNTVISSMANGAANVAYTHTIIFKQAATGGPYTVTWPATLEWPNDALAPAMPTVPNAELIVHLFWTGQAWRAIPGGVFFP